MHHCHAPQALTGKPHVVAGNFRPWRRAEPTDQLLEISASKRSICAITNADQYELKCWGHRDVTAIPADVVPAI